jgi:hypothetical protein
MLFKEEQPLNIPLLITLMLLGKITFLRFRQLRKASSPISITLFGMLMLSNDEQSANAPVPIVVKPMYYYVVSLES